MATLLTDSCCLVGLGAAGLVVVVGAVAALARGGQMLAGRLAAKRANGALKTVKDR